VQARVPVLMAAMSASGLDLAARHADIVALSGLLHVRGRPAGTFTTASADETDDRVAQVRTVRADSGLPPAELDALLQQVVIDRDPEQSAAEFSAEVEGRISVAHLLASPFVLYAATAQDAAAQLHRRSQRWGIGSWCTHAPSGPALAQVIQAVRS
jgi:alkanesulfonate monooxygenase SsuD/methylene tetrahydromethanopterin reductase-like flavin-dependent oxidoreductase (luciferase family)